MILDGIDVFAEVVDAKSFSRAAKRLGMPTSTVSAKVARLEERLGTTLIRRTTRALSVTEAGRAYYERCVRALAEMAEAERALADVSEEPSGLLRISAPGDMAQFKLVPLVEAYLERHPKTSVDLVISNARVDLVADDIDLAVRAGRLEDSSLVVRKFLEGQIRLYASEAYLATHGVPKRVEDLAAHQIVQLTRAGDLQHLRNANGERVEIKGRTRLSCDDIQTCRAFVERGAGIGLLPQFIGDDARAPLVRVLPEIASERIAVNFVYAAQRFVPQTLRAFIDLATEFERQATPP